MTEGSDNQNEEGDIVGSARKIKRLERALEKGFAPKKWDEAIANLQSLHRLYPYDDYDNFISNRQLTGLKG